MIIQSSLIGTKDTGDNTKNTKRFINGNTCSIQHFATGTGGHVSENYGEDSELPIMVMFHLVDQWH